MSDSGFVVVPERALYKVIQRLTIASKSDRRDVRLMATAALKEWDDERGVYPMPTHEGRSP